MRHEIGVVAMMLVCLTSAAGQTIASKLQYVGLPKYLRVTGLMSKHINGLLTLQIAVSNTDINDETGYYRVDWNDGTGFSVWPAEAWKPLLLHGGQTQQWQIGAPTAQARDFTIEFTADRNSAARGQP